MAVRGGRVCQGLQEEKISPGKSEHKLCVKKMRGALHERWVMTPTQTQEIHLPSSTIKAAIMYCRCTVQLELFYTGRRSSHHGPAGFSTYLGGMN